jgi:para-nitrobenzyl esterase
MTIDVSISRRGVLGGMAGLGAIGMIGSTARAAQSATEDRPIFVTVETRTGKVEGIDNVGIKQFKGIPYGADTGGAHRFAPPRPPKPWAGVRNCIGYGPINPQLPADLRSDYAMMIMWDRHVGVGSMGEDCLNLNIWTPGVNDGGKRAVLVCFHGGGFASGSGNGPGFDGAQLARFGDVVVVTVNHRLGAFGYTHLNQLTKASDLAGAGNAGVMDMVASLKWVRDNIAQFGGDPNCVMIFGQSGGGAKTSVLYGDPRAKGLFHRAAVQSGSMLKLTDPEVATRQATALLEELNIAKERAADLRKVPWQALLSAQVRVMRRPGMAWSFVPVLDNSYFTAHPFDPAAPEFSRDVPLIVSTTLEDGAIRLSNPELTDEQLAEQMTSRYGPRSRELLAAYRRAYPNKSPFLLQAVMTTDASGRKMAIKQAEVKAAQGGAPVYMYQWNWATSAYGGRYGAIHGLDVSATFHSYRDQTLDVGSPRGRRVADELASAWVAFAKTGDPNNPQIPRWDPYETSRRATMIFDDKTRSENDPGSGFRKLWAAIPTSPTG